eukprot:1052958-Pelagomonas_calceolata.AAC.1
MLKPASARDCLAWIASKDGLTHRNPCSSPAIDAGLKTHMGKVLGRKSVEARFRCNHSNITKRYFQAAQKTAQPEKNSNSSASVNYCNCYHSASPSCGTCMRARPLACSGLVPTPACCLDGQGGSRTEDGLQCTIIKCAEHDHHKRAAGWCRGLLAALMARVIGMQRMAVVQGTAVCCFVLAWWCAAAAVCWAEVEGEALQHNVTRTALNIPCSKQCTQELQAQ